MFQVLRLSACSFSPASSLKVSILQGHSSYHSIKQAFIYLLPELSHPLPCNAPSTFKLQTYPSNCLTSPFDVPQEFFSHDESRSRQCLALTQQFQHVRADVSVLLLAFPSCLHEGSCSASHPICILDRKKDVKKGKGAPRKVFQ